MVLSNKETDKRVEKGERKEQEMKERRELCPSLYSFHIFKNTKPNQGECTI